MSEQPKPAEVFEHESEHEGDHRAPGTMVLVLVLLLAFVVYYFANWKALADVWHVR
jgi:cytochrome c oxidase subunit 1